MAAAWYNLLPEEMQPRRVNLPFFSTRNERHEFPRFGESVIIDMLALAENPPKKEISPLFGPSLTKGKRKNEEKMGYVIPKDTGEVNPEVVTNWASRTKQSTTTLQALVNLKRPSIHLSPLHPVEASTERLDHSEATHALEFEFDCDAPKCCISVLVDVDSASGSSHDKEKQSQKHVVFQIIVPGGFGRALKLEDGASLDLTKYERKPVSSTTELASSSSPAVVNGSSALPQPIDGSTADATTGSNPRPSKKRLSVLPFRRRGRQEIAGPALQVVDAEKAEAEGEEKDKKEDHGVKLVLKLEALDEEERHFQIPNIQSTFLQIARVGTAPTDGQQDTRPWVVTVTRREATIGTHTFRLHEIYGFSSSSNEAQAHTYPPPAIASADSAASECVLCLSSPREVVLLPCRHLVACKECAVNMVEYGAGGQLVHTNDATEDPANTTGGEPSGDGAEHAETPNVETAASGEPATTPSGGVAQAGENSSRGREHRPHRRRKRKAKGWFCPVCRQPYTSLLRISATPPEKPVEASQSTGKSNRNSVATAVNNLDPDKSGKEKKDADVQEDTRPSEDQDPRSSGETATAPEPVNAPRTPTISESAAP
jgi:hypothetical protein